jgi:hypothetical protein
MQKIDYPNYKPMSDYMRFPEGDTHIRILTSGARGYEHERKIGSKFIPLGECVGLGCTYCAEGNKRKKVYVWIAYDLTAKEVKVLKTGKVLGEAICEYAQVKGIQTGAEFDLIINRKGLTKETTKYRVQDAPDSTITPEEAETVAAQKKYLLTRYF